jgi:hypothetical protein
MRRTGTGSSISAVDGHPTLKPATYRNITLAISALDHADPLEICRICNWGRDAADGFCWLQIGTLVIYADP